MLHTKNVSGDFAPKVGKRSLLHPVYHLGRHFHATQQRQDVTSIASVALRYRKRGPSTGSVDNTSVIVSVVRLLKRANLVQQQEFAHHATVEHHLLCRGFRDHWRFSFAHSTQRAWCNKTSSSPRGLQEHIALCSCRISHNFSSFESSLASLRSRCRILNEWQHRARVRHYITITKGAAIALRRWRLLNERNLAASQSRVVERWQSANWSCSQRWVRDDFAAPKDCCRRLNQCSQHNTWGLRYHLAASENPTLWHEVSPSRKHLDERLHWQCHQQVDRQKSNYSHELWIRFRLRRLNSIPAEWPLKIWHC